MRYLVSALASAHEENRQFKEAYAFVPFGYGDGAPATQADAEQEWIAKGLVPLAYKSDRGHSALWDELEQWALDHRQGVVGRQQTVRSEARLVGKECVSTCRYRWSPDH